jgi:branched-chain amino acid transport system permease protein
MTRPALALGFLTAVAALLPMLTSSRAVLTWVFLVLLYTALAQSWNLLGGFGGQVNLGYAAFFGVGALVTRMLWLSGGSLGTALLAGAVSATALGVVVGVPALRLRGHYFAIGTLAVAEILRITVDNTLPELTSLPPAVLTTYTLVPRYYLALLLAALVTAAVWWLTRSRFGYGIVAIREDEGVAEAIGVHAFRHKLLAFILSSLFAGMAGGVFAYYHVSFYPSFVFSPLWTFDVVLITFLGGLGTVWGPPVGAVFFLLLREALALRLGQLHLLVFGVLFIAVVIGLPGGFMEAARNLGQRRTGRSPTDIHSDPTSIS